MVISRLALVVLAFHLAGFTSVDPFNPESCGVNGSYTKPAEGTIVFNTSEPYAAATVGDYRLYSRTRTCEVKKGCESWVNNVRETRLFYDGNDNPVTVPSVGKVTLVNASDSLFFLTVGERGCRVYERGSRCDFGVGPRASDDLYEKFGQQKQKLTFETVYARSCLRQSIKLVFHDPKTSKWTEIEHVIFYQE